MVVLHPNKQTNINDCNISHTGIKPLQSIDNMQDLKTYAFINPNLHQQLCLCYVIQYVRYKAKVHMPH